MKELQEIRKHNNKVSYENYLKMVRRINLFNDYIKDNDLLDLSEEDMDQGFLLKHIENVVNNLDNDIYKMSSTGLAQLKTK